jgi:hypothetical protein
MGSERAQKLIGLKNIMNKNLVISGLIVAIMASTFALYRQDQKLSGVGINVPQFATASSTWYTVTTGASVRVLATSTRRVAATVDTLNCAATASLFLRTGDAASVANTGKIVFGTTTAAFGTYTSDMPVVTGSVQAITSNGTCTVLVTEWRTTTN